MNESKPAAPLLKLSVEIEAPPEKVWQALTEPDRLQSWFPLKSGGEARLGGKILLSWGSDCEWETNVTAWEPGRHVQWMDMLPDDAEPGAILPVVDWHLETRHGKTVVRLVQAGFDPNSDWQDYYDALRRGWTYFLDLLVSYVEHHFDRGRQMVWRRAPTLVPRSQLWTGLLGALGLGMTAVEGVERAGQWIDLQLGEGKVKAEVRFAEAPHVFAARIPELNQASLFIELEPGGDQPTCGVWLSTYGLPDEKLRSLENGLDQVCAGLLAPRE